MKIIINDKSCDGWHAAEVKGVEYYQMKNEKNYKKYI